MFVFNWSLVSLCLLVPALWVFLTSLFDLLVCGVRVQRVWVGSDCVVLV